MESTESDTIPFLFQGEPRVNRLPTAEPRDGSDIANPSLVSEGSATPDKDTRETARMFNTLGVALYSLLGACPVFVAGTGRKMSSPYRDELTLTHSVSRVHVHIVHRLLPVPFRSVPFRVL